VVSGLAAGIDTGALSGVLSVGGRAVAVMGTGLHHSYPKQNADLQERISKVGLVISQFLLLPERSALRGRPPVMPSGAAGPLSPWLLD
jgi:DNA processing protein